MSDAAQNSSQLSAKTRQLIESKVASGRYRSSDEVVQEALRLLDERDAAVNAAMKDLKAKVAIGLAEAKQGRLSDGEEFFAQLEQEEAANRKSA